jgi:hypothetical protein
MNSDNLKPDSYLANQRRIYGYSLNLLDANMVSDFKKGRSRQRKLKKKYMFKFSQKLPHIIEEIHPKQLSKLAESKKELLRLCLDLLEGYPGNELFVMYKSMVRLKTSTGMIIHLLKSE